MKEKVEDLRFTLKLAGAAFLALGYGVLWWFFYDLSPNFWSFLVALIGAGMLSFGSWALGYETGIMRGMQYAERIEKDVGLRGDV